MIKKTRIFLAELISNNVVRFDEIILIDLQSVE